MSHSRYDKEIRGFFRQAILNRGFEPDLMELEDLHYEFAGPIIRDKITDDCRPSCVTWRESIVFKGGQILNILTVGLVSRWEWQQVLESL
jgi:hypothetical protein